MNNDQPSLRFDHREVAVIFSLFVFVSLLMFTVGILVGKGLAQAKYESILIKDNERLRSAESLRPSFPVPTDSVPGDPHDESNPAALEPPINGAIEAAAPTTADRAPADTAVETLAPKKEEALKLIPQKTRPPDLYGNSLQEPANNGTKETDNILKNPKIKSLFDEEPGAKKRGTASVPKTTFAKQFPPSFPSGKYTVQVGSYPTEKDAAERVEALKKMGFSHAYFNMKELGEKKETFYRVGIGFYPDLPSAQQSGQMLQEKGEVKNYLVRKTDSEG